MPAIGSFRPVNEDLLRRVREYWLSRNPLVPIAGGTSVIPENGTISGTSTAGGSLPASTTTVPSPDSTLGTTGVVVTATTTPDVSVETVSPLLSAVDTVTNEVGNTFGGVPVNLLYMFGGLVFLTILRR